MELSEAMRHVAVKNPISVDELGDHLAAAHAEAPQHEMKARRGLAMIREGLAELASLGHMFHLSEISAVAPLRFPQMLYKAQFGTVDQRTVESQTEYEEATSDGWTETPSGT